MHKFFVYPLALSLGLASCASFGQQDYQTYLDGAYAFYQGFCVAQPTSNYCTADGKQKAKDAYNTAGKAIAAYNNGQIDQAALQKALKAAFKLFADFKG